MTLIKHAQSDMLLNDAAVFDFSDLARQAGLVLETAQRRAQAVLDRAKKEAAAIIERASAEGYEVGHAKGLAEGRRAGEDAARRETLESLGEQLGALTNRWTEAIDYWHRHRADMLLAAREDVLKLALELAERVVHRKISQDPTIVREQVAQSLALISHPSRVVVHVNPDDVPVLREVLPDVLSRLTNVEHADIREDREVDRGGCVIRTRRGSIDATIDMQIERIAQTLIPPAPDSESSPAGNGDVP